MSQGTVKLGPGTLYGVFATLEKESVIIKVAVYLCGCDDYETNLPTQEVMN